MNVEYKNQIQTLKEEIKRLNQLLEEAQPMGARCYSLRKQGNKWEDIIDQLKCPSALNLAKSHANTHNLPWPLRNG